MFSDPATLAVTGDGVQAVRFLVDGVVQHEDTGAPFEWTLDPKEFADGAHSIEVQAETDAGVESVQVGVTLIERKFTLTVQKGTGDGEFVEGAVVSVQADAAPAGMIFSGWTGDTEHTEAPAAGSTTVTMPASDIQIVATYRDDSTTVPSDSGWVRKVLSFENSTYSGNPFELEIDATFTHSTSGNEIKLPGYYAGNDTWKVAFMPTEKGVWNWETSSLDADLDGKTGSYEHTLDGPLLMLKADADHPKKWRLTGGPFVIPIALRCEFFCEPATTAEFTDVADFLEDNEILMLDTRLLEEVGMFGDRHDFIFDGSWKNHEFDLDVWDRMEERMDILAARGRGAHIMFYSDDAGTPGWEGKTATEGLVVRYAVARLAAYPIVMFNTGIDIAEYRTSSDVNWFGSAIADLDPYNHPVSSRVGGGSGSHLMTARNFESEGDRRAEIDVMLSRYNKSDDLPVSMDDAWHENVPSAPLDKNHSATDIRRAFWKCVSAGGLGGIVRGNGDGGSSIGYYFIKELADDLETEQWLKLINPFVDKQLGDTFGDMEPVAALATNGTALSDDNRSIILVHVIGKNDTYDGTAGGDVTVHLGGLSGSYNAIWFNPRTGAETTLDSMAAGQNHVLTPPSTDDWVLLLKKS